MFFGMDIEGQRFGTVLGARDRGQPHVFNQ